MDRRVFIASTCALPFAAKAQVKDISDAINKAGRLRMLSQRMDKAWFALAMGSEKTRAPPVLAQSIALFDDQLQDLKAFAPQTEIKETYGKLEAAWQPYKDALKSANPSKATAANLLQLDAKVLSLAHQGTVQYEAASGKPVGKLVNMAGRQRMLSQRIAKFYFAASMDVEQRIALAEIAKARTEFLAALEVLRNAPEATQHIRDELVLADAQWIFFDNAIKSLQTEGAKPHALSNVFVSSENLLSVMDKITGMYAAI